VKFLSFQQGSLYSELKIRIELQSLGDFISQISETIGRLDECLLQPPFKTIEMCINEVINIDHQVQHVHRQIIVQDFV
ncbi:hypothetical protein Csa_022846, partial [Cucumis sativus]